jgi:hypothetical protein
MSDFTQIILLQIDEFNKDTFKTYCKDDTKKTFTLGEAESKSKCYSAIDEWQQCITTGNDLLKLVGIWNENGCSGNIVQISPPADLPKSEFLLSQYIEYTNPCCVQEGARTTDSSVCPSERKFDKTIIEAKPCCKGLTNKDDMCVKHIA